MQTENMIVLDEFCSNHEVEVSFMRSLEEYGLIETIVVNKTVCVRGNELSKLEQIVRLHQELNINPEGIDVINELLKRMDDMHHEIIDLKNRLDFYSRES